MSTPTDTINDVPHTSPPSRGLEDSELLQAIRDQDEHALAALYDRYHRLIYTLALRVVGDPLSAEEIMQDVFLRCWHGAEQYTPERGQVMGWLVSITRNRAIDVLRSRPHRTRQHEVEWGGDSNLPSGFRQPAPGDERFLNEAVRQALTDLSEAQRTAIELAYYEGMTQAEIAQRLDTPLGTIKSRIRDGLQRLRRSLGTWVIIERREAQDEH